MEQEKRDSSESPLDEVMENLPTENPPADLAQRCIGALRDAEKRTVPRTWGHQLSLYASVAAGLLLVVVISGVGMSMLIQPHEKGGPGFVTARATDTAEAPSPAAEEPSGPVAGGRSMVGGLAKRPVTVPPVSGSRADQAVLSDEGYHEEGVPARPWRDTSGERQQMISRQMWIETEKVEDAFDRARALIQKAGGFIADESLSVQESGRSEGHLTARVPVEQIDGVVAQLRELGHVVQLKGQTEDRTEEYYNRGAGIRNLGSSEDELVAKYQKETNPARRQELYQQILDLRQNNQAQKGRLENLSKDTHLAVLDLTITETAGPGAFLQHVLENSGRALGWILATAIFWVPVVLLLWWLRKRKPI